MKKSKLLIAAVLAIVTVMSTATAAFAIPANSYYKISFDTTSAIEGVAGASSVPFTIENYQKPKADYLKGEAKVTLPKYSGTLPDGVTFERWNVGAAGQTVRVSSADMKVKAVISVEENHNEKQFVRDAYSGLLNRAADATGLKFWSDKLLDGTMTPAQVLTGIMATGEFKQRVLSNKEFLDMLYLVYCGPDADKKDYQTYSNKLAYGTSREKMIQTFEGLKAYKDRLVKYYYF